MIVWFGQYIGTCSDLYGAGLIEFRGSPYPLGLGLPSLEGGVPPSFDQRFSRGARPCDEVRKYLGKT